MARSLPGNVGSADQGGGAQGRAGRRVLRLGTSLDRLAETSRNQTHKQKARSLEISCKQLRTD